jgi:hypothetical protein
MYISPFEMSTHLDPEQVEAISDGDETKMIKALNAAIIEVTGYLSGYDIESELAKTGDDRNDLFIVWVKDVAVWHFINSCNVNTGLELRAKRRDEAISNLRKIQKGEMVINLSPKSSESNLPYKVTSNPKRNNHV